MLRAVADEVVDHLSEPVAGLLVRRLLRITFNRQPQNLYPVFGAFVSGGLDILTSLLSCRIRHSSDHPARATQKIGKHSLNLAFP